MFYIYFAYCERSSVNLYKLIATDSLDKVRYLIFQQCDNPVHPNCIKPSAYCNYTSWRLLFISNGPFLTIAYFGAAGRFNHFFVWSTKRSHQTLSTFYSRAISLHGQTRFAVFQLRPAQAIRCSRRRPQPFLILPQLSRQILLS